MSETTEKDPHACICEAPYPRPLTQPEGQMIHQFNCPQNHAAGLQCRAHFDMRGEALQWMVDECVDCQRLREEAAEVERQRSMTCAYCGATDGPYRMHSGVYECDTCWTWRKLNYNPTRYWYILSRMFLSSVDGYDLTHYFRKQLGFTPAGIKALVELLKLMQDRTGELADEHNMDEYWKGQAQALFDQLSGGIWPDPRKKDDDER